MFRVFYETQRYRSTNNSPKRNTIQVRGNELDLKQRSLGFQKVGLDMKKKFDSRQETNKKKLIFFETIDRQRMNQRKIPSFFTTKINYDLKLKSIPKRQSAMTKCCKKQHIQSMKALPVIRYHSVNSTYEDMSVRQIQMEMRKSLLIKKIEILH